jgi:Ca-activated chloride channel family protein
MCDYYRTLGIEKDASKDEIRDAYYEAARQKHPDASKDPATEEQFLEIQKAYEVLIDPVQRAMYDASLEKETGQPEVVVDTIYSSPVLARLDEPQLVYAVMTIGCKGDFAEFKRVPANICLVVDKSTSMEGDRLEVIKRNIFKLFERLDGEDIFSLVTFNDRAEVVIPPTLAVNLPSLKKQVSGIKAEGGTEIFQGLIRGYETLSHASLKAGGRYLVILTDGHTYGDETSCYAMARTAAQEGIVIQALGIGHEWNDNFLDRLTGLSGGSAQFINSPEDLLNSLDKRLNSLGSIYANHLRLQFEDNNDCAIRTIFRLAPDSSPLSTENPITLGNLDYQRKQVYLIEFLVSPPQKPVRRIDLLRGELVMSVIRKNAEVRFPCRLRREIVDSVDGEAPPDEIMKAVSRLTLYRLQGKARTALMENNTTEATRYLQNLATHLLSQGNPKMAKTVLKEVEAIQETGHFSKYGDKNLKYGTRALMLPPENGGQEGIT